MSSAAVARLGDACSHGATIVSGATAQTVNGRPLACMGDLVLCPIHGLNMIVTVMATTSQDGQKPYAHLGAIAHCGAVVISASPTDQVGLA